MTPEKLEKLKTIARVALIILFSLNLLVYFTSKYRTVKIPLPKVIAKKPEPIIMGEYVRQTGNTVAYQSVDLVARIEGFLEEVNFIDGTFVKKGDDLFVIEPAPYIAKVREAAAKLVSAEANHTYDALEYARQKKMYKDNATSLSNVQKWEAKDKESAANVVSAKENLIIAKINYGYTHISSPFDGRIGRHMVDIGNYVGKPAATTLATIEQLDPIYVYFNLNEIDLINLRASAKANGIDEKVIRQVPVEISLQKSMNYEYKGTLDFVNTGLNASTGTMEFRALLPNKDLQLLPGLFVQIKIALELPKTRLTVPSDSIQYDQVGPYILTLNQQNVVEQKHVTLGPYEKGIQAIEQGIHADDHIIIKGLQNASVGHEVNPVQDEKSIK